MQLKPHAIELTRKQLETQFDLIDRSVGWLNAEIAKITDDLNGEDEPGLDGEDEVDLQELHTLLAALPAIRKILEAEINRCDSCGHTGNCSYEFVDNANLVLCEKCLPQD